MRRIILASSNSGKLRELKQLLAGLDIELQPQSAFAISSVEESRPSFVENAILKARHAAHRSQLPALADDSGLIVDALGGAPGVYSARYAGPEASDQQNLSKLLDALEGVPDSMRTARFYCVMVYLMHSADPMPCICEGTWEGRILRNPQGHGGFGYDPIFYVPTHGCSAAELPQELKNAVSHRGQALRNLMERLTIRDA